jgi:hypothetical protein
VVRGQDGQVETVQYQKLTPMLLNELQKLRHDLQQLHGDADTQTQHAQQQEETIRQQHERISQQREENRNLERLAALEASLPSKAPTLAAAGAKEINTAPTYGLLRFRFAGRKHNSTSRRTRREQMNPM